MDARLTNRRRWRGVGLVAILCSMLALPAFGQTDTGGIEGVVRDSSGAVLPGVTVEISSTALMEGTRTTVTEATGNYRFLRLPVGTYVIKFSLVGFNPIDGVTS